MTDLSLATKLAIDRTLMAADRTMMGWIRTSLSMISFGFTIYKVIEGMQEKRIAVDFDGYVAGLVLTGLGTLCIIVGLVEYQDTVRSAQTNFGVSHRRYSRLIAIWVLAIGVLIFITILTRIL